MCTTQQGYVGFDGVDVYTCIKCDQVTIFVREGSKRRLSISLQIKSYHGSANLYAILHIALKETNESKNVPGIAVVGEEECASHGCCKDDCHLAGSTSSFPSKSSSVTRRLCLITLSVLLTHLLCIFTSLSLSSISCSPFFKITSE